MSSPTRQLSSSYQEILGVLLQGNSAIDPSPDDSPSLSLLVSFQISIPSSLSVPDASLHPPSQSTTLPELGDFDEREELAPASFVKGRQDNSFR